MSGAFSLSEQLDKALTEFVGEEREKIDKSIMAAGKQAKREVQARSPGDGEYRNSWKVRNNRKGHVIVVTVYNEKHYRLTHLLENSHIIRNQNGTYGRTSPGHGQVVHIKPAEEAATNFLIDELKKEL